MLRWKFPPNTGIVADRLQRTELCCSSQHAAGGRPLVSALSHLTSRGSSSQTSGLVVTATSSVFEVISNQIIQETFPYPALGPTSMFLLESYIIGRELTDA